jgi:hypothetical protein
MGTRRRPVNAVNVRDIGAKPAADRTLCIEGSLAGGSRSGRSHPRADAGEDEPPFEREAGADVGGRIEDIRLAKLGYFTVAPPLYAREGDVSDSLGRRRRPPSIC